MTYFFEAYLSTQYRPTVSSVAKWSVTWKRSVGRITPVCLTNRPCYVVTHDRQTSVVTILIHGRDIVNVTSLTNRSLFSTLFTPRLAGLRLCAC